MLFWQKMSTKWHAEFEHFCKYEAYYNERIIESLLSVLNWLADLRHEIDAYSESRNDMHKGIDCEV